MKKLSIILVALILSTALSAQVYRVSSATEASVVGTSTMHDWESEVENVSGSGSFVIENGNITSIPKLDVVFKTESIESGKSKMNSLTYEALKSEMFPDITYKINEVKEISGSKVVATGDLTIAGQTRKTDVQGVAQVDGNTITITGSKKIDMTEFGVDPPTAMLGAIKVGKDVNVLFTLKLTK